MTDMTDHNTRAGQPLLHGEDRDELRQRWVEIEEWFVDDPTDAVERADALIDDIIGRIRDALAERRTHLRGRWETLDDATTEQLRGALHDYEQLFTQLTGFSAPAGWHDQTHGSRPTAHGRPTFPRADAGSGDQQ